MTAKKFQADAKKFLKLVKEARDLGLDDLEEQGIEDTEGFCEAVYDLEEKLEDVIGVE